jgi:hypothetical protein
VIHPALPGEGVWQATFSGGGSRPPVLVMSFRPDPNYPQMVAGVAWINHARTSIWLYPGRLEPNVAMASLGPMEVPLELRSKLVASFNSGFKPADSGGGFAIGGHAYAPFKRGLATLVRHRNGPIDVTGWTSGPEPASNIIYARQNTGSSWAQSRTRISPTAPSGGPRSATLSECGAPAWVSTGAAT